MKKLFACILWLALPLIMAGPAWSLSLKNSDYCLELPDNWIAMGETELKVMAFGFMLNYSSSQQQQIRANGAKSKDAAMAGLSIMVLTIPHAVQGIDCARLKAIRHTLHDNPQWLIEAHTQGLEQYRKFELLSSQAFSNGCLLEYRFTLGLVPAYQVLGVRFSDTHTIYSLGQYMGSHNQQYSQTLLQATRGIQLPHIKSNNFSWLQGIGGLGLFAWLFSRASLTELSAYVK